MNKILLSTLCFTFIAAFGHAQYAKGDLDVSLGTGFGLYGASANDGNADSSGVNAGSGLLNLGVNYALYDKLSVGLGFERNGFLTQDDSTDTDTYGYSLNYRFNAAYLFLNGDKSSLALKGGVGLSSFKFGDRISNETVSGNGLTYEFDLEYQHYFGEHVGLFLNAGYGSYVYKYLRDQNGDLWLTDSGSESITFILSGVNARIGLQLKF